MLRMKHWSFGVILNAVKDLHILLLNTCILLNAYSLFKNLSNLSMASDRLAREEA